MVLGFIFSFIFSYRNVSFSSHWIVHTLKENGKRATKWCGGISRFLEKDLIMHVLDISTNMYRDVHSQERNKHIVDKFFDDINRSIILQTNCQIEYNGWRADEVTNRIHVEIIILSTNPSIIEKVCEIIEEQKNLPHYALQFLK